MEERAEVIVARLRQRYHRCSMRQDDGLSIAGQADLLGGQLDAGEIREVSVSLCVHVHDVTGL